MAEEVLKELLDKIEYIEENWDTKTGERLKKASVGKT
jgi:hypothetical protein